MNTQSRAKATDGKAGMAVGTPHVRRSTAGTGLRVGEADAVLPATSEIMDVTAGETAPVSFRFTVSRNTVSSPNETFHAPKQGGGEGRFSTVARSILRAWGCFVSRETLLGQNIEAIR